MIKMVASAAAFHTYVAPEHLPSRLKGTDRYVFDPERDLSWITAAQVARFFDVVQERLFALDIPVETICYRENDEPVRVVPHQ
jgi:hypothetical protein